MDLLHLYLVTSVLRDKVFYHLAAIVKDSEHNEADIISEQIMVASKYKCVHISFIIPIIKISHSKCRQSRDAEFFYKLLDVKDTSTPQCMLSCIVKTLHKEAAIKSKTTVDFQSKIIQLKTFHQYIF